MIELHLPWLECAILLPLLGVAWLAGTRDADRIRRRCIAVTSLTLLCTVGAWQDFATLHQFEAHDRWDVVSRLLGDEVLIIDELSAPLLPLSALLYLMTTVATLRTKVRRFSFGRALVSESILLATLSCRSPWLLVTLLAASTIPPWFELKERRRPTRVYVLYMGVSVFALALGCLSVKLDGIAGTAPAWGLALMIVGILIRSGIAPFHCWMTDLFEHASFGSALLFVTPIPGAYAAIRLLLPVAPDWALQSLALISLVTAVYASGMALVQREARRFFCYLFLSHSALVLVGLEIATPVGLTGALSVWLSVGLALGGFGLTLRSIEARTGRITLTDYHGLYEHTPTLAAFFLLTGLASVGFPGTFGFVGTELLVDGAVQEWSFLGMAVVAAAALNGIAVVQTYFQLFTGTVHVTSIPLRGRLPERLAVMGLALLILGGGLFPQPGIASRYHAAMQLVRAREHLGPARSPQNDDRSPATAGIDAASAALNESIALPLTVRSSHHVSTD
ncbi:NAD(P)H-quinone oxidoreductase chain 4 1 [Maioricimonas rarisocia]|uniref:NAD(P)H-quinone oxidoreductase chain 4 1 n=1 Tax=Maioricimonas rarisocia TaxID=2528026 RepID=A0A517Z4X4_9PLAN|nr:proton-conducting transporter membrane subunit [Maioricimonas rarisocia]QDU37540.1 NAD(P)H-quinone oxidoreductase chain 4 1 [Maioricimonas rarisocia]